MCVYGLDVQIEVSAPILESAWRCRPHLDDCEKRALCCATSDY